MTTPAPAQSQEPSLSEAPVEPTTSAIITNPGGILLELPADPTESSGSATTALDGTTPTETSSPPEGEEETTVTSVISDPSIDEPNSLPTSEPDGQVQETGVDDFLASLSATAISPTIHTSNHESTEFSKIPSPTEAATTSTLADGSITTIGGVITPSGDSDMIGTGLPDSVAINQPSVEVIAGSVIGAVVGIAILGALIFGFWRRRAQKRQYKINSPALDPSSKDKGEKTWEFDNGSVGPTPRAAKVRETIGNMFGAIGRLKPSAPGGSHGVNMNRGNSQFIEALPTHNRNTPSPSGSLGINTHGRSPSLENLPPLPPSRLSRNTPSPNGSLGSNMNHSRSPSLDALQAHRRSSSIYEPTHIRHSSASDALATTDRLAGWKIPEDRLADWKIPEVDMNWHKETSHAAGLPANPNPLHRRVVSNNSAERSSGALGHFSLAGTSEDPFSDDNATPPHAITFDPFEDHGAKSDYSASTYTASRYGPRSTYHQRETTYNSRDTAYGPRSTYAPRDTLAPRDTTYGLKSHYGPRSIYGPRSQRARGLTTASVVGVQSREYRSHTRSDQFDLEAYGIANARASRPLMGRQSDMGMVRESYSSKVTSRVTSTDSSLGDWTEGGPGSDDYSELGQELMNRIGELERGIASIGDAL